MWPFKCGFCSSYQELIMYLSPGWTDKGWCCHHLVQGWKGNQILRSLPTLYWWQGMSFFVSCRKYVYFWLLALSGNVLKYIRKLNHMGETLHYICTNVYIFVYFQVQRLMVYNCQLEDSGTYRAVVGRSECSATLKVSLTHGWHMKLQNCVTVPHVYVYDECFIIK